MAPRPRRRFGRSETARAWSQGALALLGALVLLLLLLNSASGPHVVHCVDTGSGGIMCTS